jgi:hypothetical protein
MPSTSKPTREHALAVSHFRSDVMLALSRLIPRLIRPPHLRTGSAVTGARGTKVWASLWTDRAVFSRAQANIPPAQARPLALAGFAGLRVPRTVVATVVDETSRCKTA